MSLSTGYDIINEIETKFWTERNLVHMSQHTPMIQQYLRIKADYEDAFLFFSLVIFMSCFLMMR